LERRKGPGMVDKIVHGLFLRIDCFLYRNYINHLPAITAPEPLFSTTAFLFRLPR